MAKAFFSLHSRIQIIEAQPKLIIFDFDGTLCDSLLWFSDAIVVAARKYRFKEISAQEKEMLRGKDTKEIMSYLGISWWKIPFIATFMRKHMEQTSSVIKTFPDTEILLHELSKRGFILGVVSSNSKINVESILGSELMKTFSYVECGTSIFGKKAKFNKIIKASKLGPKEILSIGDEVRDIEAARSLGIKSGAVTWGYAHKSALVNARADYLFESMNEILSTLSHR